MLFGNLPEEYGTPEQQERVGLFLSIGLDGCDECARKIIWPMARRPETIKAMARVVMLLVGSFHGKLDHAVRAAESGGDGEVMAVIDQAGIEDRAEIIIGLSNTYTGEMGNIDHGDDCPGCNEREEHWNAVEQRG